MGLKRNKEETIVHYSKSSKLPAILVIAIVVLSVILGIKVGSEWQQNKADKKNHNTQITSDALHQEIEQIGELATVSYYYTNMGKFEDAVKLLEHNVPFTTKSFILSYDGEIKAGIDLSAVEVEVTDGVITVTVPTASITSHEVDMDSVILYDEKNSVFNGLSAEDVTGFLGEQQKLMEEKAVNNGVLTRAQENAEKVLETLLTSFIEVNEDEENPYDLQFIIKEIETNQTESSETESDKTEANAAESSETESDKTDANAVESSETESSETESNKTDADATGTSEEATNETESNTTE